MTNYGKVLEATLFAEKHPFIRNIIEKYDQVVSKNNFLWTSGLQHIERDLLHNAPPVCSPASDISAVIVVKNEGRTILSTLCSVARHVGEIVVIDTGSTDNTLRTVKRHIKIPESDKPSGIKLIRKEFIPWSFCKAKNFGISKATRNYIWIIDGDEVCIDMPEIVSIRNTVFWMKVINVPDRNQARVPRMFPNDPDRFYFKSDIHNELVYPAGAVQEAPHFFTALHWTNLDEKKIVSRGDRYSGKIDEIASKPVKDFDDYFMLCKLCMNHSEWGMFSKFWKEAYPVWNILPAEVKKRRSDYLLFHGLAAVTEKKYGEWYIPEHISLVGETVDNQFCSFTYHYFKGEFEQAMYHAVRYMALCKTEPDNPFTAQASIQFKDVVQFKLNLLDFYLEREKNEA